MKTTDAKHISRNVLLYIGVLLLASVYIIPMSLVVITSVKSQAEAQIMSFKLPTEWYFSNFLKVLQTGNVLRGFINGLIIAGSITFLAILLCTMAAYVIARRPNRITSSVYSYLIAGMIAPFSYIPAIRLLSILGLYGKYSGLILTDVAIQIPFTTLLFVGFIKGLPKELDEAAMIDGCKPIRYFTSILIPLLKPALSTNIILLFTYGWNEFQNVLFLMPDSKKWTVPMTVFNFQGLHSYDYSLVNANLILSILPVFLVYLFLQKYIIEGMTAGAVKG